MQVKKGIEMNRETNKILTDRQTDRQTNYGICLLRVVACFFVVISHFHEYGDGVSDKLLLVITSTAVPLFMFISFYFLESGLNIHDSEKIQKRIKRIVIPQVVWTIVIWICYNILATLKLTSYIDLTGFIYQLLLGHSFNPPMWFQVDLIILTIIYILLKKISNKHFSVIIAVFVPVCFTLQYTGWNYKLFESFIYEVRYPLGRVVEVVPMCVFGVLCARYKVFDAMKRSKTLTILVSWVVAGLCWLVHSVCKIQSPRGFMYQGIPLFVLSFAVFITFFYLPLPKNRFSQHIAFLSKFTLGVYCIHFFIGQVLDAGLRFVGIACNDFAICGCVFLVSMLIAIIISKIPNPVIKSLVQ